MIKVSPQHTWMLRAWTWRVNNRGYVYRSTSVRTDRSPYPVNRTVFLHRQIMGLQYGDPREVDHLNRDPLDNTLPNLEIVTREENVRRMYRA